MSAINVAIADDHQLFRDGLASLLEAEDQFRVIIRASNGKELLDGIDAGKKPDVILLDLSMPEMDGFEFMDINRSNKLNIPVIAISMHDDGNYIKKSLKLGASGYVLKHADKDEVVQAIREVFRGKKYFNTAVSHKLFETMSTEGELLKSLSPKETEILQLIAAGLTTKEIADQLIVSSRTVDSHRANMMKKMQVKNTAELIAKANRLNLIDK